MRGISRVVSGMNSSSAASSSPLRWGILSTGRIAGVFARGLAESRTGALEAVGSRSAASAGRFALEHGIAPAHAHASYAALLADPLVEAVYIATPHPEHVEWAVKAAAAGKHVLCEKPAGMSHAEGLAMVAAAHRAGVLFMEAFMYRCHPQTAKVVELVRGGAVGPVRFVQAAFGFRSEFHPDSRLWNKVLGGGAILDVGCYPMSFARLMAGATAGGTDAFANPVEVAGTGRVHPVSGVDAMAAASLRFASGLVAQLTTSIDTQLDNSARVFGDEGWIEVPHPWVITRGGGEQTLRVHRRGVAEPESITTSAPNLYALEADTFATALRSGAKEVPTMTPADTLGNLAALDRWRFALGLVREPEPPEAAGDM